MLPSQSRERWLSRLRRYLLEGRGLDPATMAGQICVARVFVRYLEARAIDLRSVSKATIEQYLRQERRAYVRRHRHEPNDLKQWRSYRTAPIHNLLRVVHGTWPKARFEREIRALRRVLTKKRLSEATICGTIKVASCFMRYLTARKIAIDQAALSDEEAFLRWRAEVARRRHRHSHSQIQGLLRHYRRGVHYLLEAVRGQWPQQSQTDVLLKHFESHISDHSDGVVEDYRRHARLFLDYLTEKDLDPRKVTPADVNMYFRSALRRARRRKPNIVRKPRSWLRLGRRIVGAVMRSFQGEWPPGSSPSPLVAQFRSHLERHRYNPGLIPFYVAAVNQFLRFMGHLKKLPIAASREDIAAFIAMKRQAYVKRHGRTPLSERKWRSGYAGPIHRMLRMLDAGWPREGPPSDEKERVRRAVLEGYDRWLVGDHGLSQLTALKNGDAAKQLLQWLDSNGGSLKGLTVSDLDAYLAWRLPPLARISRNGMCHSIRSFLRYAYSADLTSRDLSAAVSGPSLYKFEALPRGLSEDQIQKVLRCTRGDKSPIGLRDYAMLLLLATYGLRAAEVIKLRLEDIQWREERLRIRHAKTGYESFLPLVKPVGEAVLRYLQRGRPETDLRHVFLQAIAPYQPLGKSGTLCTIIGYRQKKAGIQARASAHAFRFARAHSLLSASVPAKVIGDLFGHRSPDSTAVYLKLVTDDLRSVGLDLPDEGAPCKLGRTKIKH